MMFNIGLMGAHSLTLGNRPANLTHQKYNIMVGEGGKSIQVPGTEELIIKRGSIEPFCPNSTL